MQEQTAAFGSITPPGISIPTGLIFDHLQRLIAQSGESGSPLYNVFDASMKHSLPEDAARHAAALTAGVGLDPLTPGWQRSWTSLSEGRVVAHAFLIGGGLPSEMHRAEITVGVEAGWRRRGLGRHLVESALQWALRVPTLAWVDLQMIAANEPALKLYKRFGFRETARVADRYRVDGFEVEALTMGLHLDRLRR